MAEKKELKALILSGGNGSRLGPLTQHIPKQLIKIDNKPILVYIIEDLIKSDIYDIYIVVGPNKEKIIGSIGDGSDFGCKITYIHQEKPLGLAHAVLMAEKYLEHNHFIMVLGDNLFANGISSFIDDYRNNNFESAICVKEVDNPLSFGIVEVNNGVICGLEEKPSEPKSNLGILGLYGFSPNIFHTCKSIKPSQRGELEITDAIDFQLKSGNPICAHKYNGFWLDTGTKKDLLKANQFYINYIKKQERSIANCAIVVNSVISNSSIAEGCQIRNCIIKNSIILDNNILEDMEINNNIVLSKGVIL